MVVFTYIGSRGRARFDAEFHLLKFTLASGADLNQGLVVNGGGGSLPPLNNCVTYV